MIWIMSHLNDAPAIKNFPFGNHNLSRFMSFRWLFSTGLTALFLLVVGIVFGSIGIWKLLSKGLSEAAPFLTIGGIGNQHARVACMPACFKVFACCMQVSFLGPIMWCSCFTPGCSILAIPTILSQLTRNNFLRAATGSHDESVHVNVFLRRNVL